MPVSSNFDSSSLGGIFSPGDNLEKAPDFTHLWVEAFVGGGSGNGYGAQTVLPQLSSNS